MVPVATPGAGGVPVVTPGTGGFVPGVGRVPGTGIVPGVGIPQLGVQPGAKPPKYGRHLPTLAQPMALLCPPPTVAHPAHFSPVPSVWRAEELSCRSAQTARASHLSLQTDSNFRLEPPTSILGTLSPPTGLGFETLPLSCPALPLWGARASRA
ncbi:putative uncharacterized protein NEXN-AS1 [Terrapene carolina triunguis]|uniref:putative uncharacterized protein NEXN-AS1 n=1 Tax=Terrapene triunguis TaxID=2587831 RepID=UPI000CEF8DC5|nr:putative uncharacterized protein NEXN-AS1 [Terrapene carolina triunguis]